MIYRFLCYLIVATTLSACESDSNSSGKNHAGSPNTESPHVERADVAILVDVDANQINLTWNETEFKDSEGYVVERQEDQGPNDTSTSTSWVSQAEFPSGMGEYSFESIAVENHVFRVRALGSDRVLSTDKEKTEFRVPEYSKISILARQDGMVAVEPVRGEVTISIDGYEEINSVTYFVDTLKVGRSDVLPSYSYVLNTKILENDIHRVDAKIEYEESSVLVIPRTIETFNTNLRVLASTDSFLPNLEEVKFVGSVSSRVPVVKVEFYFNGNLVETLNDPNYCRKSKHMTDPCSENDLFAWTWKTDGELAQTANFYVLAYDEAGESARIDSSFILNRDPALILSSPLNDEFIGSDLRIVGDAYDDGGVPQVEVKIGDITLFNKMANKIDISHDMSGLPEGFYQVQIMLTDPSGLKTNKSLKFYYSQHRYGALIQSWSDVSEVSEIRNGKVLFKPQGDRLIFSSVENGLIEEFIFPIKKLGYEEIYQPVLTDSGDIVFGHYLGIFLKGFILRGEKLIDLNELAESQTTIYGFGANSAFSSPVSMGSRFGWVGRAGGYPVIFDLNTLELSTFKSPNEGGLWLAPLLVSNEDWFCQNFSVDDTPYSSQEDFAVYDYQAGSINRITNTSDSNERCAGITSQYIYYTSSPRGSDISRLYVLKRDNSEPALELDDSIRSFYPDSIKSSERVIAWTDSNNVLNVYSGEEFMFSYDNVSSFRVHDGTVVFSGDAIYVWKVGWQKEKNVWPLKDTYFLDKERLFVSRGANPVLLYEINIDL